MYDQTGSVNGSYPGFDGGYSGQVDPNIFNFFKTQFSGFGRQKGSSDFRSFEDLFNE
jgi:hypothetical protein